MNLTQVIHYTDTPHVSSFYGTGDKTFGTTLEEWGLQVTSFLDWEPRERWEWPKPGFWYNQPDAYWNQRIEYMRMLAYIKHSSHITLILNGRAQLVGEPHRIPSVLSAVRDDCGILALGWVPTSDPEVVREPGNFYNFPRGALHYWATIFTPHGAGRLLEHFYFWREKTLRDCVIELPAQSSHPVIHRYPNPGLFILSQPLPHV